VASVAPTVAVVQNPQTAVGITELVAAGGDPMATARSIAHRVAREFPETSSAGWHEQGVHTVADSEEEGPATTRVVEEAATLEVGPMCCSPFPNRTPPHTYFPVDALAMRVDTYVPGWCVSALSPAHLGGGGYHGHGGGGGGGSFVSGNGGIVLAGAATAGATGWIKLELVADLEDRALSTAGTCGSSGRMGPGASDCGADFVAGQDLVEAGPVQNGVQRLRVNSSGLYAVAVSGARGGNALASGAIVASGGDGAFAFGIFNLQANTTIEVVVGQSGNNLPQLQDFSTATGGGGGGGTFVYVRGAAEPMLVAGGGGGAGQGTTAAWGQQGSGSVNGTACIATCSSGVSGGGGLTPTTSNAGGGGGWLTDGICIANRHLCGSGRNAFFTGGSQLLSGYLEGGFGGGGSANTGGGGGGGYSGGPNNMLAAFSI
jgi:hypothetical protein